MPPRFGCFKNTLKSEISFTDWDFAIFKPYGRGNGEHCKRFPHLSTSNLWDFRDLVGNYKILVVLYGSLVVPLEIFLMFYGLFSSTFVVFFKMFYGITFWNY